MSAADKKGRRRFITRGEAVDIPHYDRPEDLPAPGDSQSGQTPVNTTPPTPPSSRQPPHTPPSGKTRRRIERSPGSLSPSAASSTRRRFSPGGSPSALSRASTLGTPTQHSGQSDMNRYGSYVKDTAAGGSTGMGLARSVTSEGSSGYKHYPSYLDSRLAELDPTRSTSHRSSRRDSSSSESSIHGSVASLHSDGSLRESTPSYHESLLTPPRSPTDKQRSRSNASRPRSWYDAPQLHSHISSESPTGFPFAASSYENLDKEGSADSVLPRASTMAAIGGPRKDNLSHLAHARSFAGHEGRESISPKPAAGSSPFMVAKHFPGGKASSWQPPGSRAADPAAGRTKYASDTNVRKYGQESATLPNHCAMESPYLRAASGESDSSSLVSVASVPAGGTTRPFRTDVHTRDTLTRDRSFDSAISEPVCMRTQPAAQEGGVFVQYGPCKARPFGNRSHTVDLLHVQPKGPSPSQATQAKSPPVKSSVKEQAKKFDCRPEVVCPPCGVPVMPTAGRPEGGPCPVSSYQSATMPVKLFEGYDRERRPSLPEQAERRVLYKEQRLKELSALPSFGSSLPKRSQSIDVTAKKAMLSRSEAPSMSQEGMLSASARTNVLMSSKPAVILEGGCHAPPTSKSVLSVHKPSVLPTVTETSFSASPPQAKDSVPQPASAKPTQEYARSVSVNEPSPTQSLVTPLCSSPELKSTDVGQLSGELSTKTVTIDSDQSAFKPFVKTHDLAVTEPSVTTCSSPLLKVKSPSQTSTTSTSSRGSTSASPRLSPHPLELWAAKETSPIRTYYDPADEQSSKPEVQRGISQESIQSAMAVLDDAIAMLNSVAKNTGTTPTSPTSTTTTETSLTPAPTAITTSTSCCTGIDLSRSGLLKYSSQAIGAKPLVTSHYASMPLPVSTSSAGSASPISGPPISAPSSELFKAVTQLASTVKTVMSNTVAPSTKAAAPALISTSVSEKTTARAGEPIVRPADGKAKGSELQGGVSREEHREIAGPSVTSDRTKPTDTSPLDQILASIEREESLLCASAIPPEQSKPEEESRAERKTDRRQPFSDRPMDREKSLEELEARRKTLIRDDSFNRSDSDPDVGCMPLPRDSVILRHRYHIKEDMSSSSDSSSPPATPRLSPRVMRRHKKPGFDTSATGDGKRRKHLNIPGKHRSGKDLVGGDRPLVSSDGQPVSHPAVGSATAHGSHPRDASSTTTGSYYSVPPTSSSSSSAAAAAASSSSSSSSSPAVVASSEVTWSTPPSTPQTLRLAAGCRHQGSPSSEPPRSAGGRPSRSADQATGPEQGVYNVHSAQTAVLGGRPGSAGLHSDSSSVSSHRRRFRVRDQETPPEQNAPSVTVRPGKKDKSLQRKSVLNLPGPDGLDHRQRDSDPSSSSSGSQSRAATLPSGRQPYLTTTSTPARHGPKGSLFSLGKTSKKEAKPSALGALISQTAILAPAVAQSHAAGDSGPVSPPSAGKEALSVRPTKMDSPHAAEAQSPPPADSKTKVKSVSPVFGVRHDIAGSVTEGQTSALYSSVSGDQMSATGRGPSPPRGKVSPPQGVPLMGRQMLNKLPCQGDHHLQQQHSSGYKQDGVSSSGSQSAYHAGASVHGASALPQTAVTPLTQTGIRAESLPSPVTLPATASPVATIATGLTPSSPGTKVKDSTARPIASPKLVRTTHLKPLSEAVPELQAFSSKLSQQPTQRQTDQGLPTSGALIYQGTKHVTKQAGQRQQHQQHRVPFISDQQHDQVEIVEMSSEKCKTVQQQQQPQQKEKVTEKVVPKSALQQQQQSEKQRTPSGDLTEQQAANNVSRTTQEEEAAGDQVERRQQKTPVTAQQPKTTAQPSEQQQKQHQPDTKPTAQQEHKTKAVSQQPATKQDTFRQKQATTQQPATTTPSEERKHQTQQQKYKAAMAKTSVLKQKAVISEVEPYAIAKAESPPPTLKAGVPKTVQRPEAKDEEQKLAGKVTTSREAEVCSEAGKKVQLEDVRCLPKVEPLYRSNLKRSASAPSYKPGVLHAQITTPEITETKLVPLDTSEEKDGSTRVSGTESSQSEKDMEFQTPPITPSTSRNDLTEKETSLRIIEDITQHIKTEYPQRDRVDHSESSDSLPEETTGQSEPDSSLPDEKSDLSGPSYLHSEERSDQSEPPFSNSEEKTNQSEQSDVQFEEKSDQSDQSAVQFEEKTDQSEQSDVQFEERTDQSEQSDVQFEEKTDQSEQSGAQFEEKTDQSEQSDVQFEERTDQSESNNNQHEEKSESVKSQPANEADETEPPIAESEFTEKQEVIEQTPVKSAETSDKHVKTESNYDAEVQSNDKEKKTSDDEETIIALDAPVTDKIAAWQKHLTQHPQQTHRQTVLTERRGLGIWSSGESVTDQVSVLTPITEEQKVEKGDCRLELTDNSGEEEEKVSVAQRIFQMENKLDEDRFTLTRPTSGFTTPRLKVIRPKGSPLKGAYTPHIQAIQPTSPLATDERQLLDKLTKVADIAMVRDVAAERRKRFMQRHCGDRRRTQPVTLEEIREADSLESVSSFRAEVLRKSSLNIFGQDSERPKEPVFIKKVKGQEVFPQHIKHERLKERHKDAVRFKTLPVTQTELNEIPESEALTIVHTQSSVKTLRQKLEEIEKMDSTEDILDGKAESKLSKSTETPGDGEKSVSKPQASGDIPQKESSLGDERGVSSSKKMQVDQVTSSMSASPAAAAASLLTTSHPQIPAQNIEISDDELDQLVEINYKQLSSHKKKKQQQQSELKKQPSANQQQLQSKSANQNVTEATVHSSQPQGKSVKSEQSQTVPKLASDINKATSANGEALSQKEKQQSANVIKQAEISDVSCKSQADAGIMDHKAGREVGVSAQKTSAVKTEKQNLTVLSTSVMHPECITEEKSKSTPEKVESETSSTVIITEVQSAIKVSAANQKSPSKQPSVEIQTSERDSLSYVKSSQVMGALKKEDTQGQSVKVGDCLSDSSQTIEGATGQEVSTTDTDTTEDELSKLTVSEKLQLFKKLDKTARLSADSEARQRRKFLDRRKKLARSQTLPVSGEDVSGIKDEERKEIAKSVTNLDQALDSGSDTCAPPDSGQCVRRGSGLTSAQQQSKTDEEKEEDPLLKLSLAEKVRLFSEKKEESPQKREAAIIRRKNRRLQSRFKTQSTEEPVTSDEVEKARISPLVMSLVKPPDPEILQSMSIKDQREFVAQWAEATLSDSGSRSGSQAGSRPSSVALDEAKLEDFTPRDEESGTDDKKRKGILKTSESHTPEVRGILKHSPPTSDREVRSILKADGATSDGESDRKPASILKHDVSHHDPEPAEHPSILKKDSPQHEAKPETHGILKRDGIQIKKEVAGESTHSILKKDSLPYDGQHEIRGILKKEPSEAKSEPEKSALKKRDSCGSTGELGLESTEGEIFVKKDVRSDSMTSADDVRRADLLPERSVLKKTSSLEIHTEPRQRSVLKKESSFESSREVELKPALKNTSSARSEAFQQGKPSLVTRSEAKKATVAQEEEVLAVVAEPVRSRGTVTPGEDENKNKTSTSGLTRSHSAHVHGRRDSSTDDDTVTSSEMSWIKNDAVARRRLRKTEERGGSTNRHSMTAELEQKLLSKSNLGKDLTEDEEKHSIHKSLEKSNSSPERTVTKVSADPVVVKLRDSKNNKQRPHSIADRMSMLKNSQEGWRTKVEEKDVNKFTVEGKLNLAGLSPKPDSPFVAKTRLPGTPGKFPLKRAKSSPNLLTKLSDSSDESDSDTQHPNRIKVLRPDDEGFKDFFKNTATERLSEEKVEVSVNDFDHLFTEASDILPTVKKIRPQRRLAGSRNPLKKLAQRDDLQEEYEEVKTGVAERELRRIKREQIAGTVHIAQEALAGLASKENFSQVSLRKTDSFGSSTPGSSYLPYKDVMLIQVKGRRHCQMRLVAPEAHSINSGDCFLLVTADSIFIWQGEFSNVIERSRASELASTIYQKRDLGCKTNYEPVLVTESKQKLTSSGERFWQILGGFGDYQPPGPVEEDELYEMYMAETTKIYGLKGDELIPLDSGYLPTYDLLNSKKVLVFDFGSEMYTWLGKHVSFNDRKKAVRLAKAIWDKGYDYGDCNINPLNPLSVEESGGLPMKSDKRPDWALFGKVTEQMETILFKEKFIDWPNAAKLIKVKGHDEEQDKEETAELVPYDVSKMLPLDTTPITMVLEGSNVGRGKTWSESVDGIQREFEILTLGVEIFHILEYDHLKLDPASLGQFHDSDTYVIRWHLMISQTGLRNIRTQEMRHSQTGRERWAYFFWQGQYSTITEKGASALMTVELDEERGPQVRVTQGKEPPCFLQLFKGRMIVHKGKREDESTNTSGPWRLYIVRGELPGECYLQEVPCKMSSLRSRTSMILLNVKTGILHVWHGSKSPSHTRQRAVDIGKGLEKSCPAEVGLHDNVEVIMCEVSEGSEKSDFLAAMDTRERTYNCLMKDPTPQRHSARLFYMHSVCGQFVATEILNPSRNHDNLCTPFPFNQEELYKASQPALFLFDNHYEVFLWQGWWPEQTEEGDNVITGSAQSRFNVNRRLAIETALNYCKEKNPDSPPKAWLVYAGLEPTKFTNLFPVWEVNEEARASNLKEDKSDGEMTSLEKLLKKLTCTQFTFSELQVRPLPEGVDPLKIESYLVDSEFQEIVKMTKEEFYALPAWKQNNIKKEVGLF